VSRVAVVVATFDGEKYLADQLDSISGQSRPPDLVVVSDDGSTDGTLTIVRDFAGRTSFPVRVVQRSTPRPSGARLTDLVAANVQRGVAALNLTDAVDFVAFADQDDVWFENKLATLLEHLEGCPDRSFAFADALLGEGPGSDRAGLLSDRWPVPQGWNAMTSADQLTFALRNPFATGACMLVRSALVASAFPPPPGWLHDRWLSIIGSALGGSLAERRPQMSYRLHDGQVWGLDEGGGDRVDRRMGRSLGRPLGLLRKLWDVQRALDALDVPADISRRARLTRLLARRTVEVG
jgi:glycosyltransferase involved in cell wall biosynthesis